MYKHHVITAALFVTSALLWYVGLQASATLAIVGAAAFEMIGWKRLMKSRANA